MEVKHGKIKHSYLNPYAPNLTSYLTSKTNIVNLRPLYLIILCAFVSYYPTLLLGQDKEWPVLKHYDQDHLNKIALPVGGIGTGTISLGGIGDLRDWEIMNKPAKGFVGTPTGNRAPIFCDLCETRWGRSENQGVDGSCGHQSI
jgi:hypothetical protein